ncbi:MAG: phosphoribosylaminoimidazolesuccinocarboxamide synthase [Planctomycetota bacterium]|nr:phosphoribosylaminoimidazolesuccinocarboxamide synthase [Planctomycetota bacterium]
MQNNNAYLGRNDDIPGLKLIASGKVRDIYEINEEHLLFVTTDRISAFDVIMNEGVPNKGKVLTTITAWWFEQTADIIQNHIVSTDVNDVDGLDDHWKEQLHGRVLIVKRAQPTPVEWVIRGYIVGSGWKEYQSTQSICGIALPAGLEQAQKLEQAIMTPTTKDDTHDEAITQEQARELVGEQVFEECLAASQALFQRGSELLGELGILLADTKFEFGICNGKVMLIDEILTPDSSRFWPAEQYRTGISPPSYDKQILRDYLETLDWDKNYPAPELDPAVLERVSERYHEVCEKIVNSTTEVAS